MLAGIPAPHAADQGARPPRVHLAADDARPLSPWVHVAIGGAAPFVQLVPVSPTPVTRRLTGALAAMRAPAQMHPSIERKILERKPTAAI